MKKIGILTFHRALNYGAVLQTYALEKKIKDLDKENTVEIIDYRCKKIEEARSIRLKLKPISVKGFARAGALILKKRKFNKFLSLIDISKNKYTKDNIDKCNEEYDKIIVGSDQVWNYNLTNKDYTYLLDFNLENKKKYSYAASLGLKELNTEKEIYIKNLQNFNKISVRENESVPILEEIGINTDGVHLDPTLLLNGDEWLNELNISKETKEKYILVYNILKPNKMFEIAKKLSEKTGIKIVYIPNGIMPNRKSGKIVFPQVVDFIKLFANAEYIITNSFHGTVFAIQFKKKFFVELQENGKANARIETLLNTCDLKRRILTNQDCEEIMNDENWEKVEKSLGKVRNNSIKYLSKILEN